MTDKERLIQISKSMQVLIDAMGDLNLKLGEAVADIRRLERVNRPKIIRDGYISTEDLNIKPNKIFW